MTAIRSGSRSSRDAWNRTYLTVPDVADDLRDRVPGRARVGDEHDRVAEVEQLLMACEKAVRDGLRPRGERVADQLEHGGPVARFLRLDQVERQRGPELPAVDDVACQPERRGLEPAEHDGDHARAVRRRADRDQHPPLLVHDHQVGLTKA